ncbi:hypothetical protein BESB_055730 [Besnoitia besnoiti]|uniref:Uncharacterized protein n=1 Tax=Besnoitia besnoiti TaxID=94643 RepID=A0A2A9MKH8_BESBE|nr:hypothetical protein BESB_055730 [Besnoitia besnoiti]PFH35922.1 hypothetical protein BESB_055730 [Besnoitia besnoiti]
MSQPPFRAARQAFAARGAPSLAADASPRRAVRHPVGDCLPSLPRTGLTAAASAACSSDFLSAPSAACAGAPQWPFIQRDTASTPAAAFPQPASWAAASAAAPSSTPSPSSPSYSSALPRADQDADPLRRCGEPRANTPLCVRSLVLGMEVALLSERVSRRPDGSLESACDRAWLCLLQAYGLYQPEAVDFLNGLLVEDRMSRILEFFQHVASTSSCSNPSSGGQRCASSASALSCPMEFAPRRGRASSAWEEAGLPLRTSSAFHAESALGETASEPGSRVSSATLSAAEGLHETTKVGLDCAAEGSGFLEAQDAQAREQSTNVLRASPRREAFSSSCSVDMQEHSSPYCCAESTPVFSFASSAEGSSPSSGCRSREELRAGSLPSLLQQVSGVSAAPADSRRAGVFALRAAARLPLMLVLSEGERKRKGLRGAERPYASSSGGSPSSSTSYGGSTRAAASPGGSIGSSIECLSEALASVDEERREDSRPRMLGFGRAAEGCEAASGDELSEADLPSPDPEAYPLDGQQTLPRPRVHRSLACAATEQFVEETSQDEEETEQPARGARTAAVGPLAADCVGERPPEIDAEEEGAEMPAHASAGLDAEGQKPRASLPAFARDCRHSEALTPVCAGAQQAVQSSSVADDSMRRKTVSSSRPVHRRRSEHAWRGARRPPRLSRSCACVYPRRAAGSGAASPATLTETLRRHSVDVVLLPAAWSRQSGSVSRSSQDFPAAFSDAFAVPLSVTSASRAGTFDDSPTSPSSPQAHFLDANSTGSTLKQFALALLLQMKENALKLELFQRRQRALVRRQETLRRHRQANLQRLHHAHKRAWAAARAARPTTPSGLAARRGQRGCGVFAGVMPLSPEYLSLARTEGDSGEPDRDRGRPPAAIPEDESLIAPFLASDTTPASASAPAGGAVPQPAAAQRPLAQHIRPFSVGDGGMLLLSLSPMDGSGVSSRERQDSGGRIPATTVPSLGAPFEADSGRAGSPFSPVATEVPPASAASAAPSRRAWGEPLRRCPAAPPQSTERQTPAAFAPQNLPFAFFSNEAYPASPYPPSPAALSADGEPHSDARGASPATWNDAAETPVQFPVDTTSRATDGLLRRSLGFSSAAATAVSAEPRADGAEAMQAEGEGIQLMTQCGASGMVTTPLSSVSAASGAGTEMTAFDIQLSARESERSPVEPAGASSAPQRWETSQASDSSSFAAPAESSRSRYMVAHQPLPCSRSDGGGSEAEAEASQDVVPHGRRERTLSSPALALIEVPNHLYRSGQLSRERHRSSETDDSVAGEGFGVFSPAGESLEGDRLRYRRGEAVPSTRRPALSHSWGPPQRETGPSVSGGLRPSSRPSRRQPADSCSLSAYAGRGLSPASMAPAEEACGSSSGLAAPWPSGYVPCLPAGGGGDLPWGSMHPAGGLRETYDQQALFHRQRRQQELLQRQLVKSEEQIQGLRALMDRLLHVVEHLESREASGV